MKALLVRILPLAVLSSLALLSVSCVKNEARADEVPVVKNQAPENPAEPAPSPEPAPEPESEPESEPAAEEAQPPEVVRTPELPKDLKVSPAMADILKMAQAGVSDDVLLAYITNSSQIYHLGSDEIVYLTDLGVSSQVITAIIQQDNTPDITEQKRAETAVKPLPPELVLNTPATNIYPSDAATPQPEQPPVEAVAAPAPESELQTAEAVAPPPPQEVPEVAFFYDRLSPYGTWVYVEGYGYCWQPTVAVANPGWRPYGDRGRWLWTDAGWYWYSDYSWGWAPFHYGRWHTTPALGWVWIPDTVWGPSWVTWRYTDAYCGWAPLPPHCYYVSGVGLSYGFGAVSVGFGFGFGYSYYTYVDWGHFHHHHAYRHYLYGERARHIHSESRPVTRYSHRGRDLIVNEGVDIKRVRGYTRDPIERVAIKTTATSTASAGRPERLLGSGGSMAVTRPTPPSRPSRSQSAIGTGGGESSGGAVRPSTRSTSTAQRPNSRSLFGATPRRSESTSSSSVPITRSRRPAQHPTTLARQASEQTAAPAQSTRPGSPAASAAEPNTRLGRPSRSEALSTPSSERPPASQPTLRTRPKGAPAVASSARTPSSGSSSRPASARQSSPSRISRQPFESYQPPARRSSSVQSSRTLRVYPQSGSGGGGTVRSPSTPSDTASPILRAPRPVTSTSRYLAPPTNPRAPGTPPPSIRTTPNRSVPSVDRSFRTRPSGSSTYNRPSRSIQSQPQPSSRGRGYISRSPAPQVNRSAAPRVSRPTPRSSSSGRSSSGSRTRSSSSSDNSGGSSRGSSGRPSRGR